MIGNLVRPVWAIASTTVGEAVRRKVLMVILFVGLAFLTIAPGLGALSARQETTVLRSMMLGIIQLTSAVIAIVLTVYLIPNEIERRTIYTILSKPVQRWQFLVGKYLGAVLALALMMAMMSVVLLLVFLWQQNFREFDKALELLKAPALFFVQMSLLAAVSVFFSTFVTPVVNFFLSGGLYLVGSMFQPIYDTISHNPNLPPIAKGLATFVNTILPNFANFNTQNPLINPEQAIQSQAGYYLTTSVYGVGYITALLILGILVFDKREV